MHKITDIEPENKPPAYLDFKKLTWIAASLVALTTFIVYLPALQNGFVNWDDPQYVFENPNIQSFNLQFLRWSLTAVVGSLWHPLTLISLALDHAVFGLNPWGYHLTNIIFHTLNTVLVFILIGQLLGYGGFRVNKPDKSALIVGTTTALLFGIHPLHVESVAWISERKDVLCAFFYLSSLIAYLKYTSYSGSKRPIFYIASIIFFIMALMSKPMAVTLPIVLLILDFYPLKRWKTASELKHILIEKIPLFALSILASLITIWAHMSHGGINTLETFPLTTRVFVAARALIFYLFKMIMPVNLAPFYPYPKDVAPFEFEYAGSLVLFLLIPLLCIWKLKREKLFSAIWLYYIVTLIPVIGIVQVGNQAAADRYTYLPSLGPFLLVGLGVGTAFERCTDKYRIAITASLLLLTGLLLNKTVTQTAIWKDSMTLWSYEIKHFPDTAYIAYNNRGTAHGHMGNYQQALMDFNKAIKINPGYAKTYQNRGLIYTKLYNFQQALKDINRAIELNITNPATAYNSRGAIYVNAGDYHQAMEDFNMAVKLDSRYAEAYYNRGTTYRILKDNPHAANDFSMAIRLNPRYAEAYNNRGNAYRDLGNYQMAIEDYNMAVKLNPQDAIAYRNRGIAYRNLGNNEQALKDFNKAEEIKHR